MRVGEWKEERGQATVEFAVVLPLVLLLVVGLITFAKGFNYSISLNHLANEGARWAVVNKIPGDTTPATATVDELKDYIRGQINNEELQDPAKTTICIFYGHTDPDAQQSDPPEIGDPVTVRLQSPLDLSVVKQVGDLASSLFGSEPGEFGEVTLTGESTMRFEQTPTLTGWDPPTCA